MNTETCPYAVGDVVTFTPNAYALGLLSAIELYGILPGDTGKIVKIEHGRYVYLEKSTPGMGLDWEMFTLVRKAGAQDREAK